VRPWYVRWYGYAVYLWPNKTEARDWMLWVILVASMSSCYNSQEAHKHAHEAINLVAGTEVFKENGERNE
jgi:hypothetical protein